ncbi:WbqC family protein [Oscillospiraceae bacterium CM]|nr:WbqC family protein [Oscillospiraceae bacterium CM]
MTAAIHQPDYIPYLGYFYKISRADVFVFLDDAQFSNTGGHDRNLFKTPLGVKALKIPVSQTLGDAINEVRTKDHLGWKAKHLSAVREHYKSAPFFDAVFPIFSELLEPAYDNIARLNEAVIVRFSHEFGFDTAFLQSSQLHIRTKKEQRVIDLCRAVGADTYLSGNGAQVYQTLAHFSENGVQLTYSAYTPFEYPQLWGSFIENLSVLDYVMNCGFNWRDDNDQRIRQFS